MQLIYKNYKIINFSDFVRILGAEQGGMQNFLIGRKSFRCFRNILKPKNK